VGERYWNGWKCQSFVQRRGGPKWERCVEDGIDPSQLQFAKVRTRKRII
jgi:hypothetical protein